MIIKLLLILPALTLAKIEIEINGEFKDQESKLVASLFGKDTTIATKKERDLFGLKDSTLKDGIRIIHGGKPDNVFVCSPTPWGDLYKTYGWTEVERTILPHHATLTRITSIPEVIALQMFENNSTKPVKVNVALSKDVKNTISSSWVKLDDLTVEDLKYKLSLNVKGVEMIFNQAFNWGQEGKKSSDETLGSTSELNLILQPHQSVTAKLEAKKAVISVKFDYESKLAGSVVCNYETPYNGHHFYKFDVNDIMAVKYLPPISESTQTVTFAFYYDSKVVVHDQNIGSQLMEKKFSKTPTSSESTLKTTGKAGAGSKEERIPEGKRTRIELTLSKENSNTNDV